MQLQITLFVPTLMYFTYSVIMAMAFFIATGNTRRLRIARWRGLANSVVRLVAGTIGFLASLLFVRTIYAAIKVD